MTARDRARKTLEYPHQDLLIYEIEQAIIAAIEEEREACLTIVEQMPVNLPPGYSGEDARWLTRRNLAEAIRAREEETDLDVASLDEIPGLPLPRENKDEKIARLETELTNARNKITILEFERLDAIEALGAEIIDDSEKVDVIKRMARILYKQETERQNSEKGIDGNRK